jgi:hypothetical protein
MDRRRKFGLAVRAILFVVFSAVACAESPPAKLPATPAGRALSEWLEAFNSDDHARMDAFSRSWSWDANAHGIAQWQSDVGGYDLLDVYTNDESYILFRLKTRTNEQEEFGKLRLKSIDPPVIDQLGAWRIPNGSRFEPVVFDAASRGKLIGEIARLLDAGYVHPDVGRKMAAALRRGESRHDYRLIRDGKDLAAGFTADLRSISHDKHLEVQFSYVVQPADPSAPDPAQEAKRLAAVNCGFLKVEHLRPNVGYVKFDGFEDAKSCGPTASAAMNFIADSSALILDLRDNHGGGGGMPEYIASYLFDARTHLDDLYSRTTGLTTPIWTSPDVPGRKFIDKPVFVLTSTGTFSAAEYLANVLRNLRGATLVGETTGGGAHLNEFRRIDAHFGLRLPTGRPLTKSDWEGKGLAPDVRVPAADALETARKLAAPAGR